MLGKFTPLGQAVAEFEAAIEYYATHPDPDLQLSAEKDILKTRARVDLEMGRLFSQELGKRYG